MRIVLSTMMMLLAGMAVAQTRPNIIVILADDLGYSDIGCYGGEVHTPNIDRLAAGGLRFTQFYNTSRCCPTRASLLTGLYNHDAGIGLMSFDQGQEGYRGYLTSNTITLAEQMKRAGYRTGMVGKWHVALTPMLKNKEEHVRWLNHQIERDSFAPKDQYPTARGFDKYYGTIWGVVDYFDPFSLVYGDKPVKSVPENYYYTDAINDSAAAFIKQWGTQKDPFFLYVAETAPHWPLMAPEKDIRKYEHVYEGGWDAVRNARFERQKKMKLFPETVQLSKRFDSSKSWSSNPDAEWDARAMAVRSAMIDRMDQGIGRILKALEESGTAKNTLIFFLSDNGASSDDAQRYGPGNDRPGATRTGKPIIYPADKKTPLGPQTVFGSHDKMWSNVSNAPFRYWKVEAYEGGICTPLIAYWPAGLKAKPGSITTQPGHVMDFMSTFSELAGIDYPKTYLGNKITETSGLSLAPILRGQTRKPHEYLFFEHLGGRAVRWGNWKLVTLDAKKPWELYDLSNDRTEMNDLANQHPEIVNRLNEAWTAWAREHHVLPKPKTKSDE